MRRRLASLLLGSLLCLVPGQGFAFPGEKSVLLGPQVRTYGLEAPSMAGLSGAWTTTLDDWFELHVPAALLTDSDGQPVLCQGGVGLRLLLDATSFVPFLEASLLAGRFFPEYSGADPLRVSLTLSPGLEYRPGRQWSLGLTGGAEADLLGGDFARAWTLAAYLRFWFGDFLD